VIAAFRERFNKAPPPNQFKIYIESEVRIFWMYGDFSATLYMYIKQNTTTYLTQGSVYNKWKNLLRLKKTKR